MHLKTPEKGDGGDGAAKQLRPRERFYEPTLLATELPMLLKPFLRLVPTVCTATTMASAIRPIISAYSVASAPWSSEMKRLIKSIAAALLGTPLLNVVCDGVADVVEAGLQVVADGLHGDDDGQCDEADHQGVLGGVRAFGISEEVLDQFHVNSFLLCLGLFLRLRVQLLAKFGMRLAMVLKPFWRFSPI